MTTSQAFCTLPPIDVCITRQSSSHTKHHESPIYLGEETRYEVVDPRLMELDANLTRLQ